MLAESSPVLRLKRTLHAEDHAKFARRLWGGSLLPAAVLASGLAFSLLPPSLKAHTPAQEPPRPPAAPPQAGQASPDFVTQRLMRLRAERRAEQPAQPVQSPPPVATL